MFKNEDVSMIEKDNGELQKAFIFRLKNSDISKNYIAPSFQLNQSGKLIDESPEDIIPVELNKDFLSFITLKNIGRFLLGELAYTLCSFPDEEIDSIYVNIAYSEDRKTAGILCTKDEVVIATKYLYEEMCHI